MPNYPDLIGTIVRKLVTKPDEVEVREEKSGTGAVLLTIEVAVEDIGRVIGKRGSTINAIRHVVKAASIKSGEKIDVDVEEK